MLDHLCVENFFNGAVTHELLEFFVRGRCKVNLLLILALQIFKLNLLKGCLLRGHRVDDKVLSSHLLSSLFYSIITHFCGNMQAAQELS